MTPGRKYMFQGIPEGIRIDPAGRHGGNAFPVIAIAITSIYCVFPLLADRSLPLGHDTVFHLFQADRFILGLKSGVYYPRWIADTVGGYGSPNFVFYAPLGYYFVALANLVFPSLIVSMIFVIWCGYLFSGITMYIAARNMFGREGSAFTAVMYQMLPFHLIDLYHRGSFAELLAYVWFPLLVSHVYDAGMSKRGRNAVVGLGLAYACLILTHLVSAFIFTLFLAVFLLLSYAGRREANILWRGIGGGAIGIGLASFYLGPVVFEKKYVQIAHLTRGPFDYANNFLFAFDRIHMHEDFFRLLNVAAGFEFFVGVLVAGFLFFHRNAISGMGKERVGIFGATFFLAFFLSTPLSRVVWDFAPYFATLQFPWRWMIVMDVSLCFLAGYVWSRRDSFVRRYSVMAKMTILCMVIGLSQAIMQSMHGIAVTEPLLDKMKDPIRLRYIMEPAYEYVPIWVKNNRILYENGREKVVLREGEATFEIREWNPESRTISVNASSDCTIGLRTFFFPGWEVHVDGERDEPSVNPETGTMEVRVAAGEHMVKFSFTDTAIRRISRYVSSCVLAALLLFPAFRFLRG